MFWMLERESFCVGYANSGIYRSGNTEDNKKELPDIVSEYLHVLALSNHSRPAFDSIRYCGDDAKKLSELYLQKQLVYEQVDSFGYPLVTPDELADTEWMTEFLFARKIRTFFSDGIGDNIESPMYYQFIPTEEDNEKHMKSMPMSY